MRTVNPHDLPALQHPAAAPEIDPDGRQICWRCREPYHPDGSPNLVLCGECDLAEYEAYDQGLR
jgi:hypothetical protein